MSRLAGTVPEGTHPPSARTTYSHTKVCQVRTGACDNQPALPKETESREQSKDFAHTSTKDTYSQTMQRKTSPRSIDKRMGHRRLTPFFKDTINSTNYNEQCTNGIKYQTTNSYAEQEFGTRKCVNRTTTNHQCMDKAVCIINELISGSYVSEPDKMDIFRTISQSIQTKQQATNTPPTKQGRTNGRSTGEKHCPHRGNIPVKEDFNREHSSSTYTQ